MAEGDKFRDPDTGETFIETATGAIKKAPELISTGVMGLTRGVTAAAAGATAGAKDLMLMPAGVTDPIAGALGFAGVDEAAESMAGVGESLRARREALTSPFEEVMAAEYPAPFIAGTVIGGSPIPAVGRAPGAIAGGLYGIGLGETLEDKVINFGLGVVLGPVGARSARAAMQRSSRAAQAISPSAQTRTRAQSAARLRQAGVPMTEGDLASPGVTGAPARRRDLVRDTAAPGQADAAKRSRFNEVVTETIAPGQGQDAIDDAWIAARRDEIDQMYAQIRDEVGTVQRSQATDDIADRLVQLGEDIPPTRRDDISFYIDRILADIDAGTMTGQRWTTLRSDIAASARGADNFEVSQRLYQVREMLDDMVANSNPQIRQDLAQVNQQWQLVEVLDSPGVIRPEDLTINPTSYVRNMKSMFPGVTRGRANERAQDLFQLMRDAQRFPAFRSSGTAERLTAGEGPVSRIRRSLSTAAIPEAVGASAGRRTVQEIDEERED